MTEKLKEIKQRMDEGEVDTVIDQLNQIHRTVV